MAYIKVESLLADILDEKIHNTSQPAQTALSHFERMVNRQPTADVVPKSEVEREIFDEIEAIIRKYDERPKYQLMLDLAELKKKYTEDKV